MDLRSAWAVRKRIPLVVLAAAGLLCIAGIPAPLQGAPQEDKQDESQGGNARRKAEEEKKETASTAVPRVSLGEITGTPGSSLMVPLYYTPDPKIPLRSLTMEIDYVSNNLKFQKASKGVVPEQVGADLSATVTDGTPDSKGLTRSKLRVSVALVEKDPKEGLPEGLVAFLLFQITPEAKPFAIRLNTSVVSAEGLQSPPQQVAKVNAVPGTIVIEAAEGLPEATCFFFNH